MAYTDHWKDHPYSIDWLYGHVFDYDRPMKIMDWLRIIGVIPNNVAWTRKNALTKTSLDGNAIKGSYLAELALDWDEDGESTVREFLEALEFEVSGTAKNRNVAEVMGDLGRD